jgi:hypothetical protein
MARPELSCIPPISGLGCIEHSAPESFAWALLLEAGVGDGDGGWWNRNDEPSLLASRVWAVFERKSALG